MPAATIGWAYTCPLTVVEKSWPKSEAETADGARPGSALSQPVRRLSTETVVMSAFAGTGRKTAAASVNAAGRRRMRARRMTRSWRGTATMKDRTVTWSMPYRKMLTVL